VGFGGGLLLLRQFSKCYIVLEGLSDGMRPIPSGSGCMPGREEVAEDLRWARFLRRGILIFRYPVLRFIENRAIR